MSVVDLSLPDHDERERLEALRRLSLLPHLVPSPALDGLVELAAFVCGTPIALVTLVEQHDQFFKAQVGLDVAGTKREDSFCTHAIQGSGVYEVCNAATDPIFVDNPLVTGEHNIRFYAGAPMTTDSGHRIGTVCVLDDHPRALSAYQRVVLEKLAHTCVSLFEQRAVQRRQHHWFTQTLKGVADAVVSVDEAGVVNYANPAASSVLGLTNDDLLGLEVGTDFHFAAADLSGTNPLVTCLEQGHATTLACDAVLSVGGARHEVEYTVAPVRDEGDDGQVMGGVMVFRDVAGQRALQRQAHNDALTGTFNRFAFEARLTEHLARPGTKAGAVIYFDLDRFKGVNDSLGHGVGDDILREISERISDCIGVDGLFARIGGDEFGVLLADVDRAGAFGVAVRLLASLQHLRSSYTDARANIGASIGVAMLDEPGLTVAEVLRRADTGCYAAKNAGGDRVRMFDPTDDDVEAWSGSLRWLNVVQKALRNDEFVLFGQRIASLADGRPSVEVLLRLAHEGELVSPDNFMPAVERFVLASQLDEWVVRNTLLALADAGDALDAFERVHLNLSAKSIIDQSVAARLVELIELSPVSAEKLCFEITETAAIADLGSARRFMQTIRGLGCQVALDDFGRGFASFEHLKKLPIDVVKIDGMFVNDVAADPVSRHMVAAVRGACHHLGIETIAECVENIEVLDELMVLGIDAVQGFLHHRPEALTLALGALELRDVAGQPQGVS